MNLYGGYSIRAAITIDGDFYQKALELADPQMDKVGLFRVAVNTFVRVQVAKRLAALGGTAPNVAVLARRR